MLSLSSLKVCHSRYSICVQGLTGSAEAPKQDEFVSIEQCETTAEQADEWTRLVRQKAGPGGVDKLFQEKGIDLLVAPAESMLCVYSAYAGYPIATAPLTTLTFNGRPWGIAVITKAGQEGLLLRFIAAIEELVGGHPLPEALIKFERKEPEAEVVSKDMMLDL